MNIRHNNCDKTYVGKYNEKFDILKSEEKEEWYDDIFQMSLLIYLLLENKKNSSKIKYFKQ